MNRDTFDPNLPLGYRWATEAETEAWTMRGYALLGERLVPRLFDGERKLYPRDARPSALAVLDAKNLEILRNRLEAFDTYPDPRVGDFVDFTDGVIRRFSHDWGPSGLQTSDGGSWYLGSNYMSFSGSLYPSVPLSTLSRAEGTRSGSTWFFYHDWAGAGRAVDVTVPLRVYRCSLTSKEAS